MAMQTIDNIVLQARAHFNQLTKPATIRMLLKAGISEDAIEGCTITVLKNILTRRYLFGAIVAVWKQFPADITRFIGEFFDCDHFRFHRIRRQLRKERSDHAIQICSIDRWFQKNEENPMADHYFHMQTKSRIYSLTRQTMDYWALGSEFIAEKYKVLQEREVKEWERLKREQYASFRLSDAQHRIDGDIDALHLRINAINDKRIAGEELSSQEMMHDMHKLMLEAEELQRCVQDHMVCE
jgi:hypothetical protein